MTLLGRVLACVLVPVGLFGCSTRDSAVSQNNELSVVDKPLNGFFGTSSSADGDGFAKPIDTSYDDTPCEDAQASIDGFTNNIYEFMLLDGECFGIEHDAALKKEVPLEMAVPEAGAEVPLDISASVLLYNNPHNRYNAFLSFAFRVVNISDQLWCGVSFDDQIRFYDDADRLLAAMPAVALLHGHLYSSGGVEAYSSCLGPGESAVFADFDSSVSAGDSLMTTEMFSRIERAVVDRAVGFEAVRVQRPFVQLPNLLPLELRTENTSSSDPFIIASFLNGTGRVARLLGASHTIHFYDDEGYFLGSDRLSLHTALKLSSAKQLKDSDYTIHDGETFSLGGYPDIVDQMPATATRSQVFLEWVPVD